MTELPMTELETALSAANQVQLALDSLRKAEDLIKPISQFLRVNVIRTQLQESVNALCEIRSCCVGLMQAVDEWESCEGAQPPEACDVELYVPKPSPDDPFGDDDIPF